MTEVSILAVDTHWIIVNKPAGLLAVPGKGPDKQDCLSARIQAQYADALVVHRLDMATSGLMVMARGIAAQRVLSAAFAQRLVHKRYTAVVAGVLAPHFAQWQVIDLPIQVDWPNRPLRKIDTLQGKASMTRVMALETDAVHGRTRVSLEPVTGRSHQLRVHMLAIGHPMLGDALYAPESVCAMAPRLLLHATELSLPHPEHGNSVAFASAVPF
ncbi:MAG: RNA pseudouridine synthase [Burkholderiales bacterium PBB4]|nr:MAG: RNA pseudouridine synthase [Burkholderiales bacterium PBB4]